MPVRQERLNPDSWWEMPRKALQSIAPNAVSGMKKPLPDAFRVANFESVSLVAGDSLQRFWQQTPVVGNKAEFLVYTPTKLQVQEHCDRCPRRHQPLNLSCSKTKGTATRYTDASVLYGPRKKFRFEIIDETTVQRARVRKVEVMLWKLYD